MVAWHPIGHVDQIGHVCIPHVLVVHEHAGDAFNLVGSFRERRGAVDENLYFPGLARNAALATRTTAALNPPDTISAYAARQGRRGSPVP